MLGKIKHDTSQYNYTNKTLDQHYKYRYMQR